MKAIAPVWKHGRVRCANAVHARMFDEELIILDLAKGEYFAMDNVGARLWSGLEAGRTIDQIAKDVVAEYDVDLDRAITDLVTLGDELLARGLMVRDEAPAEGENRGSP